MGDENKKRKDEDDVANDTARSDVANDTAGNKDYIEVIKNLKSSTVSKKDYEALKDENKKLIEALVEGGQLPDSAKKMETVDMDQLRKELYGNGANLSNLDYCKKTLQLRKAIMDEGGIDPFVPQGYSIQPTGDDFLQAEKVANYLQEAIDYADGDSDLFTQELQRNMKDVIIPRKKR